MISSHPLRCLLPVLLVGMMICLTGCGGSGGRKFKTGPVSKKMLGKWETRSGFTKKTQIEFCDDNTAKVTTTKESKTDSWVAGWYVQEEGEKEMKIQLQAGKGDDYEIRTVKWLNNDSFELKRGATIIGRYVRL